MRVCVTLICILLMCSTLSAQQLRGVVFESSGKPFSAVTVALFYQSDTTHPIRLSVTDSKGIYEFKLPHDSVYAIQISAKGYFPYWINRRIAGRKGLSTSDTIYLTNQVTVIENVSVQAVRPLLEVKADKLVMNVAGTIHAAGNDLIELLRKSPGVMLDKDDYISIAGKSGVLVYIDGRQLQLTGDALTAYLRTFQSNQIDAIEIITNPSSKYDAAGNAGIINIRMKKNKALGTNGTLNAGYGIGVYPKYNGGFTINSRNKHANYFGSLHAYDNKVWSKLTFDRKLADTFYSQRTDVAFKNNGINLKAGADFFLSNKHTLGMIISGNINETDIFNTNITDVYVASLNMQDKILVADNRSENNRNNYNTNLNYRYFDTTGRELNIDLDYGVYSIGSYQYQPNIYFDASGQTETGSAFYQMDVSNKIKLLALKTDYMFDLAKGKMSVGGKWSKANSVNKFKRFNDYNNVLELDSVRSNLFDYHESILALYTEYMWSYKQLTFQAGVRMEHTVAKGTSEDFSVSQPGLQTFTRNYTDFFSSIGITLKKNSNSQFSLKYGRRIDRPVYQDLNPFEFRVDDYTFQRGNPYLKPQYTHTVTLSHLFKFRLNSSLSYSHVNNMFAQLVDTIDVSKAFIMKENLAKQNILSLTLSYPFNYNKYGLFVNLVSYYSKYDANFGLGKTIDLDIYSMNLYIQQSYKFSGRWAVELSAWGSTPTIWQGTMRTNTFGLVDFGVTHNLFKDKSGQLKVVVSDIFRTMGWKANSAFAGQVYNASGVFESRQLKVNFSWNFGNKEMRASTIRKSGLEEESKRVQSESGTIGQ